MAGAREPAGGGFTDFMWGVATASYQIEGSVEAEGRGRSIWDDFCRTPGAVLGGMTGDLACDSFRRWKEDVELIRALGVGSYRFSLAWPRIQPTGSGRPLQAGLDHYRRLCEALLEAGIEPAATLYHWDLPSALEESGGWPERDTALRFAEYADILYGALGDLIGRWFTVNEPWCAAFLGYGLGLHAPGLRDEASAYRAAHHLLLGHGLAVKAHRARGLGSPIGIVLNPVTPRPATARPENLAAAERASGAQTRLWLDPLYGRGYPEDHLACHPAARLPVEAGDLEIIATDCDMLGINYYTEMAVEAAPYGPSCPEGWRPALSWRDKTDMGWDIVPEGLYRQIMTLTGRWPVKELFVTENGAAFRDELEPAGTPDGFPPEEGGGPAYRVRDRDRISYLVSHIEACLRARAEGAPLRGYYAWSLLDNFEWSYGYSKRFGLVHVDFQNGRRRPKDSFWFYRDTIANQVPRTLLA
jgi:beta-glucosidase